ncbi:MAG: N-acetylmuramoyl-L-alanine amidase [Verrucomicrobiota bacterium]
MSKPVFAFACALLVLVAGCSTTPRPRDPSKPLPANWDADLGPQHELEPDVALPARPQPPPTNIVQKAPAPLTSAESGMVSLNRWAAQNGLRELRTVALPPAPSYAVVTPQGSFAVQIGRLTAFWDGLEVRLGFPPQQIGNQIFLNALDIRKILEPLAHGLAVATSANRLVVIDPGHGGSNTGARNVVAGRYEKDYTLDWAKRLVPLLEQNGWRVALTRTNDIFLSRAERVEFADAHRASLFISLHFNTTGDGNPGPAGLETYCVTPAGMPSSLTRGYTDDVRVIFPNNAFDGENLRYAVRLHRSLLQVNGHNDRGIRHARFLDVLVGQQRPAVLIEGGYLSNPAEAKLVADAAYRQKLAEAVAKALE